MDQDDDKKDAQEDQTAITATYPLVRFSEMSEDVLPEVVDLAAGFVEKHTGDTEAASKAIKEEMDKIYGPNWHVVIGEAFGFEVSYQKDNFVYMFCGGNLGICVWKCS